MRFITSINSLTALARDNREEQAIWLVDSGVIAFFESAQSLAADCDQDMVQASASGDQEFEISCYRGLLRFPFLPGAGYSFATIQLPLTCKIIRHSAVQVTEALAFIQWRRGRASP